MDERLKYFDENEEVECELCGWKGYGRDVDYNDFLEIYECPECGFAGVGEKTINRTINETISYLKEPEGYDVNKFISDLIVEIDQLDGHYPDEVSLEYDREYLMTLEEFAHIFYWKIIDSVCNVLESFKIS